MLQPRKQPDLRLDRIQLVLSHVGQRDALDCDRLARHGVQRLKHGAEASSPQLPPQPIGSQIVDTVKLPRAAREAGDLRAPRGHLHLILISIHVAVLSLLWAMLSQARRSTADW